MAQNPYSPTSANGKSIMNSGDGSMAKSGPNPIQPIRSEVGSSYDPSMDASKNGMEDPEEGTPTFNSSGQTYSYSPKNFTMSAYPGTQSDAMMRRLSSFTNV